MVFVRSLRLTRAHLLPSVSQYGTRLPASQFQPPPFAQCLSFIPSPTCQLRSLARQYQRRKDVIPVSDTIYALSTAPGRAAIAVIRISGPACLDIYGGLCPHRPFPLPRTATLRKLHDPRCSLDCEVRVLDASALVLYFPAPTTVTGEPILELHVHGGPAIVRSVLDAIPACSDTRPRRRTGEYSLIRPAEAGEFTKRAFYNGRLDLTQAEALGDTLAAETEQQRRLAVSGSESGLAIRYEEWRKMLLYARGELEALIDFSEDQRFDESPQELVSSITLQVVALKTQIELHIKNASKGELLRSGISIALLGAPNAGKSSLLNRIVGREAAIVNAEAGTTRDIVDVSVDIGGWLCRLGDMAGLRDKVTVLSSPDSASNHLGVVEKEGIRRARARALESDVVVVMLALESPDDSMMPNQLFINDEVVDAVRECQKAKKEIVIVINKVDLANVDGSVLSAEQVSSCMQQAFPFIQEPRVFLVSCKLAEHRAAAKPSSDPGGIQNLLNGLTSIFAEMTIATTDSSVSLPSSQAQSYWSASLSISHRQSSYLQECLAHLETFLANSGHQRPISHASTSSLHHIDNHDDIVGEMGPDSEVDIVALAEDLRFAANCLAKITGRGEGGDVEDVLGVVFEK